MTVAAGCRAAVVVGGGALGRAIGDRLAEAGARVAMVDRPRGWNEAGSALAAVAERWGGIDLLVNELVEGAGDEPTGSFATAHPAAIEAGVEAVLPVAVATTRAALDVMVRGAGGRIVYVVAASGLAGRPGHVTYDAGQAAVVGLTRNLARELPDHGITVVAVAAGTIVDPGAVAATVAFLASPAGSAIHGTVVSVGAEVSA